MKLATSSRVLARVYESSSSAYAEAYRVFLKCTDQKSQARDKLQTIIDGLDFRRVLLDIGAGDGTFTGWFAGQFVHTVAVEPNPHFARSLRAQLPKAKVIEMPLVDADPGASGDLVLCANVMFHIPRRDWRESVLRMIDWVAPNGVLVLFLQSSDTDCMKMLRHFGVHPGSLRDLRAEILQETGSSYLLTLDKVSAYVTTTNERDGYQVAEFMLNCLPPTEPPTSDDFREYVDTHFRGPLGRFRFSCHLDCLVVRSAPR